MKHQIVLQIRDADNHTSASFRVWYPSQELAEEAVNRSLPLIFLKGIAQCENLEPHLKLNLKGIAFETNANKKRNDYLQKTGN